MGNYGDAIFGTGLGLAQSAFNGLIGEWSAKQAYERQLDFWNKQNAYNRSFYFVI